MSQLDNYLSPWEMDFPGVESLGLLLVGLNPLLPRGILLGARHPRWGEVLEAVERDGSQLTEPGESRWPAEGTDESQQGLQSVCIVLREPQRHSGDIPKRSLPSWSYAGEDC